MTLITEIDSIRKLYVDCLTDIGIKEDDFLVAIGKLKSNSVYHVIESKKTQTIKGFRFHLKVIKSDLVTCIKRKSDQGLIPMVWNSRNKKH